VKYEDFLRVKSTEQPHTGLTDIPDLPACLFPFQRDIVRWALRRGRRGVGIELKPSYYAQAVRNLDAAKKRQSGLFAA
jgi:hypothetical protein